MYGLSDPDLRRSQITFRSSPGFAEVIDFRYLQRAREPVSRSKAGVQGKVADVYGGRSRHAESQNELRAFQVLLATGRTNDWQEQPFHLDYHLDGARHRYTPDILVAWGSHREVVEIKFTHPKHKHVFALKMVGNDEWLIFEPWWNRIMVTTLGIDEAVKFLRWGAAGSILKVRERIQGNGSQARGWANCAVQISLMLGRPYLTWTPHGLYRRLSTEEGVKPVDLAKFLEEKVISATETIVEDALGDTSALVTLSPQAAFTELGARISKIIFSPKYLALYRFATSEASRFPAAAAAFFAYGPLRVESAVKTLVSGFCEPLRSRTYEPERLARSFLSMLRGNRHIELAMGCNTEPDQKGVASRTRSVVDFLLRAIEERGAGRWKNRGRLVNSLREKSIEMARKDRHFGRLLAEKGSPAKSAILGNALGPS